MSSTLLPLAAAIAFAAQFALVAILFFLFVIFLIWLVRLICRGLLALLRILPGSIPIKLVAISAAAWLFPGLLNFLVYLAFNLFSFVFIDFPRTLLPGIKTAAGQCLTTDVGVCLGIQSEAFYKAWIDVIVPLFRKVDAYNLPVLSPLFFVTLAVIFSSLLDYLAQPIDSERRGVRLVRAVPVMWGKVAQSRRNGILLGLILAVAAYLCLASIIAIPSLKSESLPESVGSENLRIQILQSSFTEDQKNSYPEKILGEFPNLSGLEGRSDALTGFLQTYASGQQQELAQLESDWNALRQYYFGRQEELARTSVKTYELDNIGRKGTREQIQHFIDVDAWFRVWRSSAETTLANCRSAITRADNETRRLNQAIVFLGPSIGETSRLPELITQTLKNAPELSAQAKELCRTGQDTVDIPRRAEFGSYLGPFGAMSFWLLKTESLPFVLITGLLGFGLLGAGCSTFIRYREQQAADALAAERVGGVIVRGASAAVVVFLGVYGGLAVFSSSATEPNAYATFFLCLVAAVFSEEAWDWAHHRFKTELGKRPPDRKERQAPQKERK
jgi:hypothetical protein